MNPDTSHTLSITTKNLLIAIQVLLERNETNVHLTNRSLLLLRVEQEIQQFLESRVSSFVDFFELNGSDWMLNHEHRMIRRAKRFTLGFGQCLECVRNHCDRESPAFLQLD